MKLINLITLGC